MAPKRKKSDTSAAALLQSVISSKPQQWMPLQSLAMAIEGRENMAHELLLEAGGKKKFAALLGRIISDRSCCDKRRGQVAWVIAATVQELPIFGEEVVSEVSAIGNLFFELLQSSCDDCKSNVLWAISTMVCTFSFLDIFLIFCLFFFSATKSRVLANRFSMLIHSNSQASSSSY